MVSLGCLLAQKVAILSMFLLEFKQVMGETYEFTQARKCKTPWSIMQVIMKTGVCKIEFGGKHE
jgi:hypothetical protein